MLLNKDPKFWGTLICGIALGWWACTLYVILDENSRQEHRRVAKQKLQEWIKSHPGETVKMEWNRTVPDPQETLP